MANEYKQNSATVFVLLPRGVLSEIMIIPFLTHVMTSTLERNNGKC